MAAIEKCRDGGLEIMIDAKITLCLALLVLGAGARAAVAAPLDDAAENYRPYMIEGIGQALVGARNLRERVAASDLAGAKKEIFELIRDVADAGAAVVLFSSDIEEVANVCHRVIIMRHGRVSGELTREQVSEDVIIAASQGTHEAA